MDALTELGVLYERHQAYFARGTDDEVWLPFVGERGWSVLTKDKNNRYNQWEKEAVVKFGVREFYFASGNLSGKDMGDALRVAMPAMRRTQAEHEPPFVASIARYGGVTVVYDRKGSTHERRQPPKKAKAADAI
jgi:hypothetical protein